MRIALFNWRDIRHPSAGGAEAFVHQVLRLLVEQGHEATLFTSSYSGSLPRETIDGVEHVRYAGRLLIYPKSYLCYRKHIKGRYDAIVESINGPPFFTKLFAKEKVVPFIHQLTRQNWYSGLPLPLAFLGYHLEGPMLSLYKDSPAIVPSGSTRSDLERLGFRDVTVVHGGGDISPPIPIEKQPEPTLIYLGRLTRSKRVDHAIRAFAALRKRMPEARLWVVGRGSEAHSLKALSQQLGLTGITFHGHVTEERKAELLSKAHLMLFPAVREGWGLTVLEANACSTPVIGYDVHGLRDSVRPGLNGLLVRDGDIQGMADAASGLLNDRDSLRRLAASSSEYSAGFSWSRAADEFIALLERVTG
jgi:glycosyltransferase involved in cell wall biosynthesis